jgi:hypothetical protein
VRANSLDYIISLQRRFFQKHCHHWTRFVCGTELFAHVSSKILNFAQLRSPLAYDVNKPFVKQRCRIDNLLELTKPQSAVLLGKAQFTFMHEFDWERFEIEGLAVF